MSTRRKTEEPPSRTSGGAEGDSPLGCDAEGAAGGPSGPLHGSSAGITRQGPAGAQKAQPNLRHLPTERIDFLSKEQLSKEGGKKKGRLLYLCSSGWALVVGCACMCSAPYGRKRRPRSAGIIFPVRVAQTEPERRESTEGAVDGSRMVSVEMARKSF